VLIEIADSDGFQSTPPVAGRRCVVAPESTPESMTVSIHAPRCREAMPHCGFRVQVRVMFQSTPPVAGRRCYGVFST